MNPHHPDAGHGCCPGRQLGYPAGPWCGTSTRCGAVSCALTGGAAISSCVRLGHALTLLYALLQTGWCKGRHRCRAVGRAGFCLRTSSVSEIVCSRCPIPNRWTVGRRRAARPGRGDLLLVGMAIAGYWAGRALFNRPGYELFDYSVRLTRLPAMRRDGGVGRPPRWPTLCRCLLDLCEDHIASRATRASRFSECTLPRALFERLGGYTRVGVQRPRELGRALNNAVRASPSRRTADLIRRQPHQADRGARPSRSASRRSASRSHGSSSPTACASTSRPTSASAADGASVPTRRNTRPRRPAPAHAAPRDGWGSTSEFPPDEKGLASR